ncbi:hypothetical protein KC364_g49 [Hortaea werneckii]|nr:hypothetical protein KC364_g49 [Hortaea werneckii]
MVLSHSFASCLVLEPSLSAMLMLVSSITRVSFSCCAMLVVCFFVQVADVMIACALCLSLFVLLQDGC